MRLAVHSEEPAAAGDKEFLQCLLRLRTRFPTKFASMLSIHREDSLRPVGARNDPEKNVFNSLHAISYKRFAHATRELSKLLLDPLLLVFGRLATLVAENPLSRRLPG